MTDVIIRQNGNVGHITLNRPDALNALTYDMICLLYTSPSPRDVEESRMPSSA